MIGNESFRQRISRIQSKVLIGVLVLVVAMVSAGLTLPKVFFLGYLSSYIFWLGVPLGALALMMMSYLTGGKWTYAIRPFYESLIRTLLLFMILLIPILWWTDLIFPWRDPGVLASGHGGHSFPHKEIYFELAFFLGRALIYLLCWGILAWIYSIKRETTPYQRLRNLSGPGLILYAFTATFAGIDWSMSLEPHWYSAIFPMIFFIGQLLTSQALVIVLVYLLSKSFGKSYESSFEPSLLQDWGNLLMALVLTWGYLSFSQFLIIWSGNKPEETVWYHHRIHGIPGVIAFIIAIFHLALPFFLLLFKGIKRRAGLLSMVALVVLATHVLEIAWQVLPNLQEGGAWSMVGMKILTFLGMGFLWLWVYLEELKKVSLHPEIPEVANGE